MPEDYFIQSSNKDKNEKPIATISISRIIKKYAKKAEVPTEGIKSHSGRVTAINFLLDRDVPIRDVANFAGHSDVKTTQTYDRKSQDKIAQTCKIINFS